METILVYNQTVPFVEVDDDDTFKLKDGTSFETFSRETDFFEVPVTVKLVEFFKSCGIEAEPTVKIGGTILGPKINLGFQTFRTNTSSQTGYLNMRSLGIHTDLFDDSDDVFNNHNVSLRLDVETMTEDISKCSLKPAVFSDVIEMCRDDANDLDWFVSSHDICLTFKSSESDDSGDVDKLLQNWTRSNSEWKMTCSLSLILTPKSKRNRLDQDVADHLLPYKRMRTDDTFSDFAIIAGNGAVIKCHRTILAAQSAYFARMLQSGMKEATSGSLELSGMTEGGVGALLDYLYAWNTTTPETNPLVCVELLEAGHKYDIQPMEEYMKKILLSKSSDWYTPEAAFQLVLFVKDMDMDELKQKAIKVYKARFAEIQKLSVYGELFKESPDVLKTLIEYLSTV